MIVKIVKFRHQFLALLASGAVTLACSTESASSNQSKQASKPSRLISDEDDDAGEENDEDLSGCSLDGDADSLALNGSDVDSWDSDQCDGDLAASGPQTNALPKVNPGAPAPVTVPPTIAQVPPTTGGGLGAGGLGAGGLGGGLGAGGLGSLLGGGGGAGGLGSLLGGGGGFGSLFGGLLGGLGGTQPGSP